MARDHRWTKRYRVGLCRQTWMQKEGRWGGVEGIKDGTRRKRWMQGEGELATRGLEPDIRDGLERGCRGN